MPAVKTLPLDPADLTSQFRQAAEEAGFREEFLGECDGAVLSAYTRRTPGVKPRIYVSSGVHGDEPAPPWALLQMLQSGMFDGRANWFLIPLLNPAGFRRQQRENADGIDLNRDYLHPRSHEVACHLKWLGRQPRFDLALCLHEDWESTGFYLYELTRNPDPRLAHAMRDAAAQHMPIEPEAVIDGRPIDEPGIIRPDPDPALRETWPEAIYLYQHHTDLCFTLETPSQLDFSLRREVQLAATQSLLNALL